MAITVTDDGAVVWKLEGGMSLTLTLREAGGEEVRNGDVRAVLPDPTGKPIISARFQYFDRVGPRYLKQIAQKHIVFRPPEFSSQAKDYFRTHIGMGLDSIVDQLFSSGDSVERFNSTSDVGYFCLDVTREGWVGSPYFWAWLDPPGDKIEPGNPYFEVAKEANAARRVEAARALREAEALYQIQIEPRSLVEQVMRQDGEAEMQMQMQEEGRRGEDEPPQQSDSDSDSEVEEMPLGPTRADWMRLWLHSGKWSLTHQCFRDTDCAICLERLIEGDRVTGIPCEALHCFHTDCIVPWLNVMNLCPLCRYYMPTTTQHHH